MAFKERAIDDSQDCCNNASGVRHIPELCQINSYMYMFKGQGEGRSSSGTNLARFPNSFDHW